MTESNNSFSIDFLVPSRFKRESTQNIILKQLGQEHTDLRHKFNLPNPDSITGQSFFDINDQRHKYYNQLISLATENKFIFKSEKFFQKHPELGSYYLANSDVLLINPRKVNTIVNQNTGRKYDRLSYLLDLTQELTRGLVKRSNPDIPDDELARLSVLSVFSPHRISTTPDFATKTLPDLIAKNLQLHQKIK